MLRFQEEKSQRKLDMLKRKEEEESTRLLADQYGLPYLDLSTFPIDLDAIRLIEEDRARKGRLAIFDAAGKRLKIGARNPTQEDTRRALQSLSNDHYTFDLFVVSEHSLEHAWSVYQKVPDAVSREIGAIQISDEKISILQQGIQDIRSIQEQIEKTFFSHTTELLELILAGAITVDASDVHLEAHHDGARLRFRLDGVLHDIAELPARAYVFLLSRIKLISELKLNIHDRAQDGRFTIRTRVKTRGLSEIAIEVRTSILPGPNGENTVLRILNPASLLVPFNDLGMQVWIIDAMTRELARPNGMILTTGPTGSGKTTTLYTFLKKIYNPEIKVITLEDPIEYHIAGIEQTQVDHEKGYDFANGLRAIVRQDPDVILVGEIRDNETAEVAVNAALTGHLVFSTLHTNNAAGAIPRLMALGVKSTSMAPAVKVMMAQRLVRKLCPSCRAPLALSQELTHRIQKELKTFPKTVPIPPQERWTIFAPPLIPCAACNSTGYKGRVGLYEIILMDEDVQALIIHGDASEFDLRKAQERQEQISMHQDGILKVLIGLTDFEEVERVVGS